jgi:hypothetical protein
MEFNWRYAVRVSDRAHFFDGAKWGSFPLHRPHERRVELQASRRLRQRRQAARVLLTEDQMSDHKGARLMLDALPPASVMIADRVMTATGSARRSRSVGQSPAFHLPKAAGRHSITIRHSIATGTRSKTSSQNLRTCGASPHATTDAPTPSFRPFASQQPSHSISINES